MKKRELATFVALLLFAVSCGESDVLPPDSGYELKVLTFEDVDAKFAPYELTYCSRAIATWSDLVDDAQYNGPLLYDQSGGEYSWADVGNTELAHTLQTPFWAGGHAISNYVITDYANLPSGYFGWYELQLATPMGGANGSKNFAVHNSSQMGTQIPALVFADGVARVIDHLYVTNTCYMLNALIYGDAFSAPASESSLLKIVATGYDSNGAKKGSAEIVVCQGKKAVDEWVKFELHSLGAVVKVEFSFWASDDLIGDYGVRVPTYFAYDNVVEGYPFRTQYLCIWRR